MTDVMNWQPIKTAPTDGTAVDIWVPDEAYEEGGQRFPDMKFQEGDVTTPSDWDGDMMLLSDCGYSLDDVTHWMQVIPPTT